MPKSAKLSTEEAKAKALEQFALGATVRDAMKAVGRQPKTHENWRASDLDYKNAVDAARDRSTRAKDAGKDPALYELGFAEWRKRFLGRDTYPHQQMWIDVLEEREPVVFHPAITYRPGNHNYVLINTPPAHAKSSTITMDYATYKLCMNPAYRVIIISKIAEMASKFLH
ncbi:MAG TPA: hypothetical protein VFR02_01110, partial [bacterium]|nr:hypothetical protein [bacterium]